MVPVRSTVPGPLYSLDAIEHKSGSRQRIILLCREKSVGREVCSEVLQG